MLKEDLRDNESVQKVNDIETVAQSGFTLIELIVVITIISLLAGTVVVSVIGQGDKAKKAIVLKDFHAMRQASELYYTDFGRWPESIEDLLSPGEDNSGEEAAPYLSKRPKDPWKNEYIWDIDDDNKPLFICYGADGAEGGVKENKDMRTDDES